MSSEPRPDSAPPPSTHAWNPLRPAPENQAQVVAVIVLLVIVSLIIGGLYLAQATTNITTVRDIERLQLERSRVERDNERLRAEIARLQSIDNLRVRAATLGYEEASAEDMQFIVVEGYVYNQPTLLPTAVVASATPEDYEENFAGWLKRQFDSLREEFSDWAE